MAEKLFEERESWIKSPEIYWRNLFSSKLKFDCGKHLEKSEILWRKWRMHCRETSRADYEKYPLFHGRNEKMRTNLSLRISSANIYFEIANINNLSTGFV